MLVNMLRMGESLAKSTLEARVIVSTALCIINSKVFEEKFIEKKDIRWPDWSAIKRTSLLPFILLIKLLSQRALKGRAFLFRVNFRCALI